MHESFVRGFILPIIPHRPWYLMGTTKVMELGSIVSFLLQDIPGDAVIVLYKLGLLPNRVASVVILLAYGLHLR